MSNSTDTTNLRYMIALDDRIDLCEEVLSTTGIPAAADREKAADLKRVVFDGIIRTIENGVAKSKLGLWTDTDLGESALLRSKSMAMVTASSPGSGGHSLEKLKVEFTAVQLALNPDGPEDARKELLGRLKVVSHKAREENSPLLIELDALPTATQIEMYGSKDEARAMLILLAMQQLQDAGVAPAAWAFEPTSDDVYTEVIAAQAQIDNQNGKVFLVTSSSIEGSIGVGVDNSERRVIELAAKTMGVSGVLVGPGSYFEHLVQLHEGSINRDEAVNSIAGRLGEIDEIFQNSMAPSEVH